MGPDAAQELMEQDPEARGSCTSTGMCASTTDGRPSCLGAICAAMLVLRGMTDTGLTTRLDVVLLIHLPLTSGLSNLLNRKIVPHSFWTRLR